MRSIIFDIETSAHPLDSLSESQQEYLLRYAEKVKDEDIRNEKIDDAIRYMSLYPFTAGVVAIGLHDVEKDKNFVYYESAENEEWSPENRDVQYKGLSEKEMLESFWRIAEVADRIVSFNGRMFDAPFLMLRSALLKVKPTRNLVTKRFDRSFHIDLLDQLTFYGLTRKFNLDFYCNAFGIKSPKSRGVSGMDVKTLYEAGRVREIASYCADDVHATSELYSIWNEYLCF